MVLEDSLLGYDVECYTMEKEQKRLNMDKWTPQIKGEQFIVQNSNVKINPSNMN